MATGQQKGDTGAIKPSKEDAVETILDGSADCMQRLAGFSVRLYEHTFIMPPVSGFGELVAQWRV